MMRTNACLLLPLGVLGLALPGVARAAAPEVPADVARLNAAEAKIRASEVSGGAAHAMFVDLFAGFLVDTASNVAREQSLLDKIDVGSPGFRRLAERRVAGPVAAALHKSGDERQDALYDVMATFSTREAAHDLLADWLWAPATGDLAKDAMRAAAERGESARAAARKEADEKRGARPLTDEERKAQLLDDAVRDARRDPSLSAARIQARFQRQVLADGEASAAFRVPERGTALISDKGNGGDDNGVVDAGEWVTFTLPVENATRDHWFSSSAWVRSLTPCVWVPLSREVVLPELAPGGSGTVTVRAFVSETCTDQSRARFGVTIQDTHRTTEQAPAELKIGLLVTNVGSPSLRRYLMDVDVPGSSGSGTSGRLDPNTSAEVSAGVVLERPGAQRALQGWGFSWPVKSILVDHGFSLGAPMAPVAGGNGSAFEAADDLDLRVGTELARTVGDGQGPRGGGVIALDTRVEYPGLEGAWAPPRTVAVPKPVPVAPAPVVPDAEQVLGMLRKHISVEARKTEPDRGALAAASTAAYDAVLDRQAFLEDWCRATRAPVPAGETDPCGPTLVQRAETASLTVPALSASPAAGLRGSSWSGASSAGAWSAPASGFGVRLNMGQAEWDLADGSGQSESQAELLSSLWYEKGETNRLRANVALASGTGTVVTLAGGVGRAVPVKSRLELEPFADGGIAVVNAYDGGETTAFLDLGADATFYALPVPNGRWLSVSAGVAWRQQVATLSGPTSNGSIYVASDDLRDASGLRMQVGVGVRFGQPGGTGARASEPLPVAAPVVSVPMPVVREAVASAPAQEAPAVEQIGVPAFDAPAAYTFRHYVWTDFNTWRPRNVIKLDLNTGGRSMAGFEGWDASMTGYEAPFSEGRETLFGLGYERGLNNRARVGLFYGASDVPYEASVLTASAGYGRALSLARNRLELEPYVDGGLAFLSVTEGGDSTAYADLGADVRWFAVRRVSLSAGAAWRQQLFTLSKPSIADKAFPADALRDATGLRLDAGVGFHF
jgi:hypothetical protein